MHTKASILVVDDEPDLLENIVLALDAEGYQVHSAPDGLQALAKLESEDIDLILADIAMPNMNGYQLYQKVRENPEWLFVPFIFLTARGLNTDIDYGRELGVDDYIIKPVRVAELFSAVKGRLRRARELEETLMHQVTSRAEPPEYINIGNLHIDLNQHKVWLNNEEIKLSAKEFLLLACLAENPGSVLSPQELVKTTHNLTANSSEATTLLGPLLHSLRRKLGFDIGDTGFIENVRSVGYRLLLPNY
ncbi:MAG TPA: response regulator transcription factor [Anaerolineae bacterium]|nr:response regulator transcription factor [Anaerolineae bacterium]